ncbi:fructose-6-phosphate aldolase [candidate division TA06 bacterium]|uniref:Probable transaldolase n=1 Tax=candidate division TA06 bacterium TaxID=2250710 RepID=A0A660SAC2_UNCT6|nr:MAG: fructose-6-phosphate aldolase [candidate division TA06 bacterium]
MKIFLDTANLDEIKNAAEANLIDGITTNPSLMAREIKRTGLESDAILKKITELVSGPISAEVVSKNLTEMVEEARKLKKIAPQIVIKIPMTFDGMKAVRRLNREGINTNVTLVFSANQALLAAKAGATYVSPFVGRLDDIGNEGMNLVGEILTIFDNYNFKTEVIVASVRHPKHVKEAALMGAHIATIPYKTLNQLFKHCLTDQGIIKFDNDWKDANK